MQSLELNDINIFDNKRYSWGLLCICIFLMIIESFFLNKRVGIISSWNIVLYICSLIPLIVLIAEKRVENSYSKYLLPVFIIMIIDMFYYKNDMTQIILPIIFYILLFIVYLTSMHKVHSFYQSFIPTFKTRFNILDLVKNFLESLFFKKDDRKIYFRVAIALLITLPFLFVFLFLFFNADSSYGLFIKDIFSFKYNISMFTFLQVPGYLLFYLGFFIYCFSNNKTRRTIADPKSLDLLIVGIFLSMINLLFFTFLFFQFPYLFNFDKIPEGMSLAKFAREGFFQLMIVMLIVLSIFIFIMKRFKDEMLLSILLGGLILQTIIMGCISLKKMYLYQSVKGATVLRYYVEWFDYFLISILLLSLFILIKRISFNKLLNVVSILGILSFLTIISLNVESLVASHNIKKFKNNPLLLDVNAISELSIDILPVIQNTNIKLRTRYLNCTSFSTYHYGYCSKISKYGTSKLRSMYK